MWTRSKNDLHLDPACKLENLIEIKLRFSLELKFLFCSSLLNNWIKRIIVDLNNFQSSRSHSTKRSKRLMKLVNQVKTTRKKVFQFNSNSLRRVKENSSRLSISWIIMTRYQRNLLLTIIQCNECGICFFVASSFPWAATTCLSGKCPS